MALRNKKLDAVKIFLITLVVFGHILLLEGLVPVGQPQGYDALTRHTVHGIYAFHMPLFVFYRDFSRGRNHFWNNGIVQRNC